MIELKELTLHQGFLTALARKLVRDPHFADELVQETWLAAIERPPRDRSNLRGWLSRVLRSRLSNLRRSNRRRAEHEERSFGQGRVPTPDELVMHRDLEERVEMALGEMEPRYREALALHLMHDRSVRQIAGDLDIEVSTVRTRLSRGLQHLRLSLDRAYGGKRQVWSLALLGYGREEATAQASLGAAVLVAVAAAFVLVGGAMWLVLSAGLSADSVEAASRVVVAGDELEDHFPDDSSPSPDGVRSSAPRRIQPMAFSRSTGVAVPGDEETPESTEAPETLPTIPDDQLLLILDPVRAGVGEYRLALRDKMPTGTSYYGLGPHQVLCRVVDAGGQPIADARGSLTLGSYGLPLRPEVPMLAGWVKAFTEGESDENGWLTFKYDRALNVILRIEAEGYGLWRESIKPGPVGSAPFNVQLTKEAGLRGVVHYENGDPAPHACVEVWPTDPEQLWRISAICDERGSYSTSEIPAGPARLRATSSGEEAPGQIEAELTFTEGSIDQWRPRLQVTDWIRGRALDEQGEPLGGHTVIAARRDPVRDPASLDGIPELKKQSLSATTDATGCFQFYDLEAGPYFLGLLDPTVPGHREPLAAVRDVDPRGEEVVLQVGVRRTGNGVLRGRIVVDGEDEPDLTRTRVFLIDLEYPAGYLTLALGGGASFETCSLPAAGYHFKVSRRRASLEERLVELPAGASTDLGDIVIPFAFPFEFLPVFSGDTTPDYEVSIRKNGAVEVGLDPATTSGDSSVTGWHLTVTSRERSVPLRCWYDVKQHLKKTGNIQAYIPEAGEYILEVRRLIDGVVDPDSRRVTEFDAAPKGLLKVPLEY